MLLENRTILKSGKTDWAEKAQRSERTKLIREFRQAFKRSPAEARLELLKWAGEHVFFRQKPLILGAMRERFDETKYRYIHLNRCNVCGFRAEHRHHAFLLKHGGSNISENIYCLCENCHKVLHSWL